MIKGIVKYQVVGHHIDEVMSKYRYPYFTSVGHQYLRKSQKTTKNYLAQKSLSNKGVPQHGR
jgi:hypothetical protein